MPRAAVAWSRSGATLVAATAHVAVLVDDASIAAVEPTTGADRWTRRKVAASDEVALGATESIAAATTRCGKAAATAVAASDEYVAVGFDDGRVEVLAAAGGALAATVELGDGSLDRAVRGVAALEHDDDLEPCVLNVFLEPHQFYLQLSQGDGVAQVPASLPGGPVEVAVANVGYEPELGVEVRAAGRPELARRRHHRPCVVLLNRA